MDLRSGRYTGDWMTNLGDPAFPVELWEHIFSFLPGMSLCMIRLVCRRWRDIFGSCLELQNRLMVSLERLDESENLFMDEDFVIPPLLPLPNLRLDNWDILAINWWTAFSWKLREVSIFRCTVHITTLLKMLEESPNLKTLRLRALWFRTNGDSLETNFRLEGMRQLTMDSVHYDGLSDADVILTFVKLFPRLEDFQMRIPTSLRILIRVVQKLQDTLKSLEVIPKRAADSLLPTLCQLKEPRLKRLSFDTRDTFCFEDWINLFKAQPLLEELIVDVDRNSIMLDIANTAPAIKALSLYLVRTISMNFLNFLPHLRFLEINGYTYDRYAPLPLGVAAELVCCPALRVFRQFQMTFVGFLEFFANSPNIETILLEDVKLEHPIPPETSTATFPYLRDLDISDCFSVKAVLVHIFTNSPLLERVRLLHMNEIDDETIGVLCQRANRLRKLEIDQCLTLSDTSGRLIIEHCAQLQELRLYLNRFSLGMLQQLKQTRNIRVWYSYCRELELNGVENA